MVRYQHAGGAVVTQLAAPIGSSDSSFTVLDASGYPTGAVGPFWVVLGAGSANEEKVLCSTRVGNVFTVASGGRGGDDTVAVPHSPPEQVRHVFTAREADEANAHINATSGVHGVSSDVVGRTDSQDIRNKILNGAFNTFSNIPQSAVTGLAARLDTAYWLGTKVADNTINPGAQGSPGTLTTVVASGITTVPGGHSSSRRVPVDGLYLVNYRLRYNCGDGVLEAGDFRLMLGLNPADPANTTDLGTVVAQHQTRHNFTGGRRIHVRSTSTSIPAGSTNHVITAGFGTTLPSVPHIVLINLPTGTSSAQGWDIRTDTYTTTNFRLIMDRSVGPTPNTISMPLDIMAVYGTDSVAGHTVEMSTVLSLNEGDVVAFRLWNNGNELPVVIHGNTQVSACSIVWLGPR